MGHLPALLTCALTPLAGAQPSNLLENPGFEAGDRTPEAWVIGELPRGVQARRDTRFTHEGEGALTFRKSVKTYWPFAQVAQSFERDPEQDALQIGAMIRAKDAFKLVIEVQFSGGGEFSKEWGAYIGAEDEGDPPADHDWKAYAGEVAIPAWAERITLAFQLYGPGSVWIDDAFARYTEPAPERAGAGDVRPVLAPEDRTLGEDKHKRYFLHRPEGDAPEGGWPLLVVLPGGDGSADFKGFVNAIAANALEGRFLVAQPVAPVWIRRDDRIVWPTSALPDEDMTFPTEAFLDEIHAELSQEFELDASRCFLLGWSSGGPPSYYAALREDTPFRGALVAMSIYKPQNLPKKKDADGKAFYILHSPDDFIAMRFPKLAERQLRARGAATTLVTYPGGHGWRGDVHGMIAEGVAWLEEHSD